MKENHKKSLTSFVCHDDDRCDGAESFRIKNLNGYQVLRVNIQVVDFVVLRRNAREAGEKVKLRLWKSLFPSLVRSDSSFLLPSC